VNWLCVVNRLCAVRSVSHRRRSISRLGLVGVVAIVAACSEQTEPRVPDGEASAGAGEGGRGSGGQGREQQGPRPSMNAAAANAFRAGQAAFRKGDLAAARGHFKAATEADSNAYEAYYALGTTHQRLAETELAAEAYRRALDLVPDYEPAIEGITRLYLASNRVSDAETYLNRLRSQVPNSAAVLAALAEIKSIQKDSAAAQQLAQQALKANPDYRPAMVTLARDHYRNRRLDLALYALTAILDGYGPENPPRDKNNGEARLIRALIYKEQGQRKLAMEELRRVVELRPDIVEARVNLAVYMLEAGNAPEAVPLLEGALAYDPSHVLVHLNLGDAYRLQGRPDEALKQLTWVTQADPTLAQAHYNIGLVYLFSEPPAGVTPAAAIDKAIAEFETYVKMQPRTRPGAGDDAPELLARAKNKKAIMEAMNAAPPAAESTSGGTTDDGFDEFE
jgi:tetratricopeptide (TPR) repeat protein